jgi:hypothetical protein
MKLTLQKTPASQVQPQTAPPLQTVVSVPNFHQNYHQHGERQVPRRAETPG